MLRKILMVTALFVFLSGLLGTAVSATPSDRSVAISAATENGAQIDSCTSVAPPFWYDFIAAAGAPNACQKCIEQGRVFEPMGWFVHCWIVSNIRVELWGYLPSPTGEHQPRLLPGVGQ